MNNNTNCTVCKKLLRGRQTKFCSVTCKSKLLQSYPSQKKRGLARKLDLVKTFGGHCSICGYSRNLAVLTFHHSQSEKRFKLDMRSLSNRKLSEVLSEAESCMLLCQNCHAELHNPTLDLANLLNEADCSNH